MLVDGVFGCWAGNFRVVRSKRPDMAALWLLVREMACRSSVENRVGLGMFCTIQADVGAVVKHGLQGVKSSNSCAIANICAVDRLNPQMYTER